jgi:hypothetical protein
MWCCTKAQAEEPNVEPDFEAYEFPKIIFDKSKSAYIVTVWRRGQRQDFEFKDHFINVFSGCPDDFSEEDLKNMHGTLLTQDQDSSSLFNSKGLLYYVFATSEDDENNNSFVWLNSHFEAVEIKKCLKKLANAL